MSDGAAEADRPDRVPREVRHNWTITRHDGTPIIDVNVPVFAGASALIVGFVVFGLTHLDQFAASVGAVQSWIASDGGWFLVLTVNVALAYLAFLGLSSYSGLRIGGPETAPEFSRGAWLAMLFSAGMGIGLMFYSVAEPLTHLANPPHGGVPGSPEAFRDAIAMTYLHWGLHAWGVYALTGLGLAYFAFNRGMPLSVRSAFEPLLGSWTEHWPGHLIDTVACVATLFGVATSLGLGAQQISAGLDHMFGVTVTPIVQIVLISLITAMATASVVLGLDKGIKRLSVLNMWIAGILLLVVLLVGPTLFVLNGFVENIGIYLNNLPQIAFWNETYTGGSWQDGWTVFYWGWWIAWAPFVGMFIARISKGRTIREFVAGTLLAATGMTFAWLAVFGGSALSIELGGLTGLADAASQDPARALFLFLDQLPQAGGVDLPGWAPVALGLLATVAIVLFFVTSSDSGSLVIDIITAGGKPNPPTPQRVFWAILEGVVAATLLLGGGLAALQTAAIAAGLPFAVLMLLMVAGIQRAISQDYRRPVAAAQPSVTAAPHVTPQEPRRD